MLLARLGADLDMPNGTESRGSAAPVPAHLGNTQMVKLLAVVRADVHRRSPGGVLPLHAAAQCGRDATVRLLLALRSPLNAQTERGNTPLWSAAADNRSTTAAILLESKADVDLSNADGATPLFIASHEGSLRTARVLVEHRCSLNKPTNQGSWCTPLAMALQKNHHDVAAFLRERGAV